VNIVPSSLRNRVVAGTVLVGLIFAVVFGAFAAWRVQRAQDQAVRASLLSRVELARDEVAPNGSLALDAGSPKTDLVQVIGPDGSIRSSSIALSHIGPLINLVDVGDSPGGFQANVTLQSPDIDLAVLAVPLRLNQTTASPGGHGALVVAVDAEGFNTATSNLLVLLVAGLAAVVLAMAALSWILTGRALRSVNLITESAETVDPDELTHGLPVPRRDVELARLVRALNRMLKRLKEGHATELAFAADAGHRLRTPVATLRAEAELALRETHPADVTAALKRIVRDADQLTSIVDRMLARSRARNQPPEPVLNVLNQAWSRWHRQAELAAVTLTVTVDPEVTPQTRCAEVADIIEPILDNAVRYTPPGGDIDIRIRLDSRPAATLVVDISNTGDPISDQLAQNMFEAWVSGRDASVAGGLGLWLARETARDLKGDVTLVNDGTHATTIRVSLPVVTSPADQGQRVTG
jgi:signal transduction histidine kinase